MTVLKNIFSQWYKYLLWALISVIFWGWIFTLVTDAPAAKKLVLCVDARELRDQALADALSENRPEGIRQIAVHSFDYYIFDTEELRTADLYIVGESRAEKYMESFLPLAETGMAAEGRTLWTHDGTAYGLLVYDASSGEGAADGYIGYVQPGAEPENYYLFFGAETVHREDGKPAELAELLLSVRQEGNE